MYNIVLIFPFVFGVYFASIQDCLYTHREAHERCQKYLSPKTYSCMAREQKYIHAKQTIQVYPCTHINAKETFLGVHREKQNTT